MSEMELKRLFKIIENHEKRICALEGKKEIKRTSGVKTWYRSGSTSEKLVQLIKEEFFDITRNIKEIISELKTKDYHLKAPDLTLPLRKIVRRGLLKRTKKRTDGSTSKIWLYVAVRK